MYQNEHTVEGETEQNKKMTKIGSARKPKSYDGPESSQHCNLRKHMQKDKKQAN